MISAERMLDNDGTSSQNRGESKLWTSCRSKLEGWDYACTTWFFKFMMIFFLWHLKLPLHSSTQYWVSHDLPGSTKAHYAVLQAQVVSSYMGFTCSQTIHEPGWPVRSKPGIKQHGLAWSILSSLMRYSVRWEQWDVLAHGSLWCLHIKNIKFIDLLDKRSGTSHRRCVIGGHLWHYGPTQCRMMS